MRPVMAFIAAALFLPLASGQSVPDAAEILKEVGATYTAASSYELETSAVLDLPGTPGQRKYSLHLWFAAPDKYRLQSSGEFCADQGTDCPPGVHEVLTVYHGKTLWDYSPESNEYRVYTAPNLPRDIRPEDVDLYMGAGLFRHALEAFTNANFLREERITSSGREVDCEVIGVVYGGSSASLWIDKNRHFVLRMESKDADSGYGTDVTYKVVGLNQPLADDLFDFKPPTGAGKIDSGKPFGLSKK